MRPHEVRERQARVGRAREERPPGVQIGDALAGIVVVAYEAAAVFFALQRLAEEQIEQRPAIRLRAERRREFPEEPDPGVDIRGAVVAVHHGDGRAVRRRHHVDLPVDAQRVVRHDHREVRGARRDVARAHAHGIRRRHARARVALAGRERDAGAQCAARIEEARTFFGQRARRLPRAQDARQDLTQVDPGQGAEFLQHSRVVVALRAVDREHAGGLPDARALFAREPPVDVARERR